MPTARIGNAGGTRLLTLIQVARERQPSQNMSSSREVPDKDLWLAQAPMIAPWLRPLQAQPQGRGLVQELPWYLP